jgi:hypothetical protein
MRGSGCVSLADAKGHPEEREFDLARLQPHLCHQCPMIDSSPPAAINSLARGYANSVNQSALSGPTVMP